MEQKSDKSLRIIHFNDVYNIEGQQPEPVGGAARFVSAINRRRKEKIEKTAVLFSGDAYSPSQMSSLYNGVQMIEPLNKMHIDAACLGNHELDYALEEIIDLTKKNNFPWIMSNVVNSLTDEGIAQTLEYYILEKNGVKIGIMGLAEEEWLGFITQIDANIIEYEDFIDCAQRMCNFFKQDQNCDLIVALTHMRNPNDKALAKYVPDIDIILGGHDHIKHLELLNKGQTLLLKSGTDFQLLSYSDIEYLNDNKENVQSDIENNIFVIKNQWKITVNFDEITKEVEEDEEIKKHVDYYIKQTEKQMQTIVGYTSIPLETRFSVIRTQESNWSNFYADICRVDMDADIAIINSGTIRSDMVYQEGYINFNDLNKMLPMRDIILVVELNGKQIHEALESGVSKYPSFEGRFPMVSNIKFTFDAAKPPMQRIKKQDIYLKGQPIDYERLYSIATKHFLSLGKDGYDVFKQSRYIVDEENGTPHMDCMKNFFFSFKRDKVNSDQLQSLNEEFTKKSQLEQNSQSFEISDGQIDQQQNQNTDITEQLDILQPLALQKQTSVKRQSIIRQNSHRNSFKPNKSLQQICGFERKSSQIMLEVIKEQQQLKTSKYDIYKSLGLIECIKFCEETGEQVIQICPKNDQRIICINPKI